MRWRSSGRRNRGAEHLPDFIELVAVAVKAGSSPTAAITAAGRHAPDELAATIDEFTHRLQRGQCLADALPAFADTLGAEASTFTDALAAADRYGLPIIPVLDQLALDARSDRRRQAERDARTLPVRLSFPLVCCTLPSFVLLAIVPAVVSAISTLRDGAS